MNVLIRDRKGKTKQNKKTQRSTGDDKAEVELCKAQPRNARIHQKLEEIGRILP